MAGQPPQPREKEVMEDQPPQPWPWVSMAMAEKAHDGAVGFFLFYYLFILGT